MFLFIWKLPSEHRKMVSGTTIHPSRHKSRTPPDWSVGYPSLINPESISFQRWIPKPPYPGRTLVSDISFIQHPRLHMTSKCNELILSDLDDFDVVSANHCWFLHTSDNGRFIQTSDDTWFSWAAYYGRVIEITPDVGRYGRREHPCWDNPCRDCACEEESEKDLKRCWMHLGYCLWWYVEGSFDLRAVENDVEDDVEIDVEMKNWGYVWRLLWAWKVERWWQLFSYTSLQLEPPGSSKWRTPPFVSNIWSSSGLVRLPRRILANDVHATIW